MVRKSVLSLLAAALMALPAQASTIALTTTPDQTNTNGAWVLGYSFTANSPIAVTMLGLYDPGGASLVTSHDVGLWDSGGNLLASATLPSGAPSFVDQDYAFTAITSVLLSAGQTYTVGATYPLLSSSGNDPWLEDPLSLTPAPQIAYDSREFEFYNGTLIMPDLVGSGTTGYFGANFEFDAASVPEPATIALFGAALAGFGAARRKRKS